jgi:serine protease
MRRAIAAVLLVLTGTCALAQRETASVIVQFKPGSAQAMKLSASPLAVRDFAGEARALHAHASTLGARTGTALTTGAAISERSQVVRASGMTSAALAARLAQDPDVEFAVPDEPMRRAVVPNDPLYLNGGSGAPAVGQWYLRPPSSTTPAAINAERAWDITTGDASIIVAVLDTGVRYDHADLAGKLLPGFDFISDVRVSNDGDGPDSDASDPGDWVSEAEAGQAPFENCPVPESSSWHGTHVAGLVGAATNNAVGIAGTGWNVRVLPVRVLGKCIGNSSDIIAGLRWAAGLVVPGVPINSNPAKVLNLSLGGEGACTSAYQSAINEVINLGKIVVAAAGNSAGHALGRPANCSGAIGVVAIRHAGTKVGFSDLGSGATIAAPGGNCVNLAGPCLYPIVSASNAGDTTPVASSSIYASGAGTSFSAPLVSGTVGLMASVRPSLTSSEAQGLLRATARAFPFRGATDESGTVVQTCVAPSTTDQLQCYCTSALCGAGMLDAQSAVAATVGLLARITASPASPAPADLITLSAATTQLPSGRSVASYNWSLVDGGGVTTGFTSATNAQTATIAAGSAGTFIVRLTVVDSAGLSSSAEATITAAVPPPPQDGGGGAIGWLGLLALAGATVLMRRARAH